MITPKSPTSPTLWAPSPLLSPLGESPRRGREVREGAHRVGEVGDLGVKEEIKAKGKAAKNSPYLCAGHKKQCVLRFFFA